MTLSTADIEQFLGADAQSILEHSCQIIPLSRIKRPSISSFEEVFLSSDRNNRVISNLYSLLSHGRLSNTGYTSILPVDQGIEHSASTSFSPNPDYFDPENIIQLAIEGNCNAVASTLGVLSLTSRKYAHKIPFIVKINHNELLTAPNTFEQIFFAQVEQAYNMGAKGIGATIYFGSQNSSQQIEKVAAAFARAHELGLFTVLWCYLRNSHFKVDGVDFHDSADLTSQANHLGATIGADIIKQKLPTRNGGYTAVNKTLKSYGKYSDKLTSDHPVDLVRYQVAHNYMGKIGLINSGGVSGTNDLADVIKMAVLNKRGGGCGLISGRKVFQKPRKEGIKLLHAIQNVYLNKDITLA